MDGHGTGTHELDFRVTRLETSVSALHEDSRKTQAAVASLGSRVGAMHTAITDIADKLDVARTKRPDMQGVAAVVGVLIIIFGLAIAPSYWRLDRAEGSLASVLAIQSERGGIIAGYRSDREHLLREIERLEDQVADIRGSRFTGEDGRQLRDKLDRHIEGHGAE